MNDLPEVLAVSLPFFASYIYALSIHNRCLPTMRSGVRASLALFVLLMCTSHVMVLSAHEQHPHDPNALQNAHTAIIGKLRAELDECRETGK